MHPRWHAPDPPRILVAIVSLGLLVRLGYLWQRAALPNFTIPYAGLDEALYHDLATRVAKGDLWLGTEVYFYSPLYTYVLGGLYAVFGVHHLVARFANVFLGLCAIVCLFYATWRFFDSYRVAALAALAAALYGPAVVFDTSRMKVSLGQFLLALAFWLLAVATKTERRALWLVIGMLLGLTLHLNEQVGLFLVGIGLWRLVCPGSSSLEPSLPATGWGQRMGQTVTLALGVSLTIVPCTVRNFLVAHEFVLLTEKSGLHFYIGNHAQAWGDIPLCQACAQPHTGNSTMRHELPLKPWGIP